MKIAIVGSGISGLTAAYILNKKHDITIYEAESWIGGHSHTVQVQDKGKSINLDTGFIVCNKTNYPNFITLLEELKVPIKKSDMSFSVSDPQYNFEYNASTKEKLFAEKRNFMNPHFYRMLFDIIKFNKLAKKVVKDPNNPIGIGKMIDSLKLGEYFYENYLMPMISSIWSSSVEDSLHIPAYFICRFFDNHGLLDLSKKIQWYTVENGSKTYVENIVKGLKTPVRLESRVVQVTRQNGKILVTTASDKHEYDKVILATHSDQALNMITDPSQQEIATLNKMEYIDNEVVLHTDTNTLPKNKKLWAAWNYRHTRGEREKPTVTYNLNILQDFLADNTYCVSLNQTESIDPHKIIETFNYSHPKYTEQSLSAQQQFSMISGVNNIYFCGAYWGQGFHEDGLNSALKAVQQIDEDLLCQTQFTVAK